MSDLISRCELFNRLATIAAPPEANDFKAEIYKVIQSMETVNKSYTWRHYEGMFYCGKCGAEFYDDILGGDIPKYCPDCGARMFEEADK